MAQRTGSAAATRLEVPPEPTVAKGEDKALNEDQQIARVEVMMLKGIRKPDILATMLDLSARQINRYIERVHARWEITGGGRDISRYRGEALSRLDLVESEAWSKFSNLDSPRDQAVFLKLIADISGQRSELLGLTPKVIERLALMPDRTNEVVARLQAQQQLSTMANRMMQLIAERRAAVGLPPARPAQAQTINHDVEDADVIEDMEA